MLGVQEDRDDIIELAAALAHIPLAIVQATAYISKRASRCSVRQYLEQFQKSDRKETGLLNHEGGQLRRDREAKNSTIITWQISFIRPTQPSAADLLSLTSFFEQSRISEALLKPGVNKETAKLIRKSQIVIVTRTVCLNLAKMMSLRAI